LLIVRYLSVLVLPWQIVLVISFVQIFTCFVGAGFVIGIRLVSD